VWSRLRQENPNCLLFRCICHSLSLAIQYAFNFLPSSIGYLLTEVPRWFSKSSVRREDFNELFDVMNPEDRTGAPKPFQKLAQTRWLVRSKVMYNILSNWYELLAYFETATPSCGFESRMKARTILNNLKDPINHLFFVFLTPVVAEFERVNSFFQSEKIDPEEMTSVLNQHYQSLRNRIFDSKGQQKSLSLIDFGHHFLSKVQEVTERFRDSQDMRDRVVTMKTCSLTFLMDCTTQIEQRLPANKSIFKGLTYLNPAFVLGQDSKVPFSQLPMQSLWGEHLDEIEEQYRKINLTDWSSLMGGQIPKDAVTFWGTLYSHETSLGKRPFLELAEYALTCLTTPVSNAAVERVFSNITFFKSKLRNRLQIPMLESLIRLKTHLISRGICCSEFVITKEMLELFNAKNVYDKPVNADEDDLLFDN
jgi:hypothetical protein